VTEDGTLVGQHEGIAFYTIGQRRGLGIAHSEPLYVVDINATRNRVVVGTRDKGLSSRLICGRMNWMAIDEPSAPIEAGVQIRYRSTPAHAVITPLGGGRFMAEFTEPQRAVTPGQAVVFYDGDTVLAGGWILSDKEPK
jgi:tRNA-specific 2-thiouridylase